MKDPKFLRTILPLSPELDSILKRVFEFNPAKRITIPELRDLIMRCPRFTATKSAASTPLPSPPFSPVDYARKPAYHGCYQPAPVPNMAPLPAPQFAAPLAEPQYTSTSSRSSQSDTESVFSSCSSASSCSSTSSFTHVNPPPSHKTVTRGAQPTYVSPPPSTHTWFNPFIQAANLVKHVSFQSPMLAAPVHVC